MKKALILHGMPSKEEYYNPEADNPSNAHWIPWIQKELLMRDYIAQTPEFPEPYLPQYDKWVEVFEQFDIDEETLLVGHSCGAGFLLRYLSENKIRVGQVVLVAPWIDATHKLDTGFFDFEIDKTLSDRVNHIMIFSSLSDHTAVIQSVNILKEEIPGIELFEFQDKGHFCLKDLGTRAFPELLKVILES